jgi:hypothetical protein
MANTYVLFRSFTNIVNGGSIDFTSISQSYDDLLIVVNARNVGASVSANLELSFNIDSATNYSTTTMQGDGASATSTRSSSQDRITFPNAIPAANAEASTWGSTSIYIPQYRSSQNKVVMASHASENNATTGYVTTSAGLWRNTAAISRIGIGGGFASGTTFNFYGIKNS